VISAPPHPRRAVPANPLVVNAYPGVRLVLTDPMPAEAVQTAHTRVSLAAEDLDGNRVAALVVELVGGWGGAGALGAGVPAAAGPADRADR
jgi:hypothetical protein